MHALTSFQGATETQLTKDESLEITLHELYSNILVYKLLRKKKKANLSPA